MKPKSARMPTPTTAPIPMPALAPVERLAEAELEGCDPVVGSVKGIEVELCVDDCIGAGVVVEV